jgi:lipid-A-disaccharide synthase
MTRRPRILISAGEASGDRLGAGLARAILERRGDAELIGMGGDEMAAAGVRLVQHLSKVTVMGLLEVVRHLPVLRKTMAMLERVISDDRPDVVVPIDFPDFNLRLAERAGRHGVPVVYYVGPQVWAWRKRRIVNIKSVVQRMLVLFPFEVPFYERAGIPVTFVGHPAAERAPCDVDPATLLADVGLDPGREVVALVPGSREAEVGRVLPTLLEAARIVRSRRAGVQFLITRAATLRTGRVESMLEASGLPDAVISRNRFPDILGGCAAGAVTSGTASLEAALMGMPMVVVYRINALSYLLVERLVHVEHASLPNLIADRPFVPELIQGEFRADKVADALVGFLESPELAASARLQLAEVKSRLGRPGAFDRAAEAVLQQIPA